MTYPQSWHLVLLRQGIGSHEAGVFMHVGEWQGIKEKEKCSPVPTE